MTRLHFPLLAFFLSFPFTLVSKEAPPHIIIAADHSASMFANGNMEVQTTAIANSINLYTLACSNVTVSYIAWGYRPADPVLFNIRDTTSARAFTRHLTNRLRWMSLDYTVHTHAMSRAILQAESIDASPTVIIFITDEYGTSVEYALPDNVSLIKISLGEIIKQVFGDLAGLCIG